MINDVSGGLADPHMARTVAEAGVPWVIMHWRGPSDRMVELATYEDVIGEVRAEMVEQVDRAVLAGVDPSLLVLDPGLGFAKTASHNWQILRKLYGVHRARLPGARRGLAQAIPRRPARRRRRHAPPARRPRDRDRGGLGARRRQTAPGACGCTRSRPSLDAVAVAAAWSWGTSPAEIEP